MSLIGVVVALLIFCVVLWAARALMAAFGIGDPIATVVYVLLVLVLLVWLWQGIGGGLGSLRIT